MMIKTPALTLPDIKDCFVPRIEEFVDVKMQSSFPLHRRSELFAFVLNALRSHLSGFGLGDAGTLGHGWIMSGDLEQVVLGRRPWH